MVARLRETPKFKRGNSKPILHGAGCGWAAWRPPDSTRIGQELLRRAKVWCDKLGDDLLGAPQNSAAIGAKSGCSEIRQIHRRRSREVNTRTVENLAQGNWQVDPDVCPVGVIADLALQNWRWEDATPAKFALGAAAWAGA